MPKRIPSVQELADQSRDEWERICAALTALEEGVNKVEDRHGKGNGLDGWKATAEGAVGYQYRRYDGRFGTAQAGKLKDNITLAKLRAPQELGASLVRVVFLPNIDLEPGHKGSEGELDRFENLRKWAASEGVALEIRGVTITHALLCKHSHVKPELFEDLAATIDMQSATLDDHSAMLHRLMSEIQALSGGNKASLHLQRLVSEAEVHYRRAQTLGSDEELRAAVRSIDDAWRLADDNDVSPELRGKILTVSSALRMRTGNLQEAREHARIAAGLLGSKADLIARGNLGLIHLELEDFAEARGEFQIVLAKAVEANDAFEIAKASMHLSRVAMALGDSESMMSHAADLDRALHAMDAADAVDPTHVDSNHILLHLYANGLLGQIYVHTARNLPDDPMAFAGAMEGYARAEEVFSSLVSEAREYGIRSLEVMSLSNLAQCIWFQNRTLEAARIFQDAARRAGEDFLKFRADALFNLALTQNELNRTLDKIESMIEALRVYEQIGDDHSAQQARSYLMDFTRTR